MFTWWVPLSRIGRWVLTIEQMDCWWNSAIENQGSSSALIWFEHWIYVIFAAIDRVHRIGQERTVHVKQYIVSQSDGDVASLC